MHREIERKFLVRKLPEQLAEFPHAEISQGYLVSLDDGLQVRLRKSNESYSLTYKRGVGNVRVVALGARRRLSADQRLLRRKSRPSEPISRPRSTSRDQSIVHFKRVLEP